MVSVSDVIRKNGSVERVIMDINGVFFVFKRINGSVAVISRYSYDNALNLDKLRVNDASYARTLKQVSAIFGRG